METIKELKKRWESRIAADYESFDMEDSFRDLLNECYSFKEVGGLFQHMTPSRVLEEMDPTAFRCGVADHADGMRDTHVELSCGNWYSVEDCNTAKDEIVAELESELAELKADEDTTDGEVDAFVELIDDFKNIEPSDL